YEHRLAMPGNVKVSRVNMMQAGRSVPVRWKQEANGLLIVSLLEPPGGEQTMTVMADCGLPRQPADVSLPAFGLDNATDDACTVRIHRQSDVQLKVEGAGGWLPIDQEQ